jgi:hypothetical protein
LFAIAIEVDIKALTVVPHSYLNEVIRFCCDIKFKELCKSCIKLVAGDVVHFSVHERNIEKRKQMAVKTANGNELEIKPADKAMVPQRK